MPGTSPPTRPVVAVLDVSNDVSDLLKTLLKAMGCKPVGAGPASAEREPGDWGAFIGAHQPQFIIVDIGPPYDANWHSFQRLRSDGLLAGRGVVVTTADKKRVWGLSGHDGDSITILDKPYGREALVDALQRVGLRVLPYAR